MMMLPLILVLVLWLGDSQNSSKSGTIGVALSFVVVPQQPITRATTRTTTSQTSSTIAVVTLQQQRFSNNGGDLLPPEVYPLSRKKVLLIDEAKRLNASLSSSSSASITSTTNDAATSSSSSSYYYSPAGWSNRLGSVVTPASIPGVYTADRPFYWNKIDVGCRMTVVQLSQSSMSSSSSSSSSSQQTAEGAILPELLIHSPVQLDPTLIDALSQLGTVSHIISPNYEHVKYAQQWAEQYPNAKVWGCPGLMDRMPHVRWTGELMEGTRPPGFIHNPPPRNKTTTNDTTTTESSVERDCIIDGMWDWDEVQPLHIDTEVNPFTRRPFFNEVVFYHALSKTLIVTDLYWNYPRGDGVTNGDLAEAAAAATLSYDDDDDDENNDFGVWELAPNVGNIPLGSKVWGKIGMDKLFYPFYMNVMIAQEKRQTFEEIARFITCGGGSSAAAADDDDHARNTRGWEVETIIPAHGDIVRGKKLCRRVLERHFQIQCHSP